MKDQNITISPPQIFTNSVVLYFSLFWTRHVPPVNCFSLKARLIPRLIALAAQSCSGNLYVKKRRYEKRFVHVISVWDFLGEHQTLRCGHWQGSIGPIFCLVQRTHARVLESRPVTEDPSDTHQRANAASYASIAVSSISINRAMSG